jgi:hypothetical protein
MAILIGNVKNSWNLIKISQGKCDGPNKFFWLVDQAQELFYANDNKLITKSIIK